MDYDDIGTIVGFIAFCVIWLVCSLNYGFLGFALGWMPAMILAPVIGVLWPLLGTLLAFAVLAVLLLVIFAK